MTTLSLLIPQAGSPDASEEPKIASDLTSLQNWGNGNIDSDNLTSATSQAAGINTAGTTVKGFVSIPTVESRSVTSYGKLATPDQVSVTVATNGLIEVRYQAQWYETVAGASRAAIFVGSNQLQVATLGANPGPSQALTNANSTTNAIAPLVSCPLGLASAQTQGLLVGTGADVTTGQALGSVGTGGLITVVGAVQVGQVAGPCYIFNLPAGTYTISVQFVALSGTVTAQNRHLWVRAISPS